MSSVYDCLEATATIMRGLTVGSTSLDNVYIYPDDQANVDIATVPFMILDEGEGLWPMGDLPTGNYARGFHAWMIHGRLYFQRKEDRWGTPHHASGREIDKGWARAINDMLSLNPTLGGTAFSIGEKRGNNYILADYAKDYDYWIDTRFWGLYFFIPVTQIYDRGG